MLNQIHLINLDRSTDRLAKFARRNSHLSSVLRSPAVDGARVDRQALLRGGLIRADCPYGNGALGCALSHIELWKKAYAEDRAVTVFEDDAIATFRLRKK